MKNKDVAVVTVPGKNMPRPGRITAVTMKPKRKDKRRSKNTKKAVEMRTMALEYQHQLAVNVRIFRTWRKIAQEKLGEMLGWNRSTIMRIESGVRCPSYGQVCVLADVLGVTVEELRQDLTEVYSAANAGTLHELLRTVRLEENLTQEVVASSCDMSIHDYRDVESGRVKPDADMMRKLTKVLGRKMSANKRSNAA